MIVWSQNGGRCSALLLQQAADGADGTNEQVVGIRGAESTLLAPFQMQPH